MEEAAACPPPRRRPPPSTWLVALLLLVIAFNEIQRTWAQSEAHRQRLELAITIAELNRKVDWLLQTMRQPTSSALPPRPPPAAGSPVRGL